MMKLKKKKDLSQTLNSGNKIRINNLIESNLKLNMKFNSQSIKLKKIIIKKHDKKNPSLSS